MTNQTETTDQPTSIDGHKILRRTRREIPHKLTRDEVHDYGQRLARQERAWDSLDAKRKDIAAQYKGDLSKVSGEISRLTNAIDSGEELRNTDVIDVLIGSQVMTMRADTLETVDQRPASYADAQEPMFPSDEDMDMSPGSDASIAAYALANGTTDEPVGEMHESSVGDAVFIGGDNEEQGEDAKPKKPRKAGKGKAKK